MARRLVLAAFFVTYALVSVYVMLNYMHSNLLRDRYIPTHFGGLYEGTGFRPYVYRMLVPTLTRGVVELSPEWVESSVKNAVADFNARDTYPGIKRVMPWLTRALPAGDTAYARVATYAVVYASLIGYMAAMYFLAQAVFPVSRAMQLFAPVMAALAIPAFTWPFQYTYDFATLFFSACCFYCMLKGKLRWYGVWFLLACLNKETAILIAVLFALWFFGRLPREQYVGMVALQAIVWLVIKLTVIYAFMDNPGVMLEQRPASVLEQDFFNNANSFRILALAGLFFLLTYRWQEKPLLLRYALWFVPVWLVAYILFGSPGEYRICFDMLPLLVLLVAHTLIETTGIGQSSLFKEAS